MNNLHVSERPAILDNKNGKRKTQYDSKRPTFTDRKAQKVSVIDQCFQTCCTKYEAPWRACQKHRLLYPTHGNIHPERWLFFSKDSIKKSHMQPWLRSSTPQKAVTSSQWERPAGQNCVHWELTANLHTDARGTGKNSRDHKGKQFLPDNNDPTDC